MEREANLGANPTVTFKEERTGFRFLDCVDRECHQGALSRSLKEVTTGGILPIQSLSEARQYAKHLEQYLIHKKCLTSICWMNCHLYLHMNQ